MASRVAARSTRAASVLRALYLGLKLLALLLGLDLTAVARAAERLDADRIEVARLGALAQNADRHLGSAAVVVRPIAGQRIEHIGDMYDPADQADLVALEPLRVAAAIGALVVLEQRRQLGAQQPAQLLLAHDLVAALR